MHIQVNVNVHVYVCLCIRMCTVCMQMICYSASLSNCSCNIAYCTLDNTLLCTSASLGWTTYQIQCNGIAISIIFDYSIRVY